VPREELDMTVNSGEFEYDVAVSFAGENRPTAEKFAEILKAHGLKVFYDEWEQANLWGRDLYEHLDEVYAKKARYCVMFLSEAYARKAWTNHERKSAQTRAFQENEEYILPLRLDDTAIPGIRATLGYLDLRKIKVEGAAQLAIQKVAAAKSRGMAVKAEEKPTAAPGPRVGKLTVKKKFSQQERDEYLDEAFEVVATFFKDTLAGLSSQSPGFSGKYKRVTANHFTAIIYRDGEKAAQCGIRLGGSTFANQIVFSENPDSTSSMNEGVSVADDGDQLFLKSSGLSSMVRAQQKAQLTPHDAAELFWGILTWRFQQ
jgi:TIR domain